MTAAIALSKEQEEQQMMVQRGTDSFRVSHHLQPGSVQTLPEKGSNVQ